MVSFVELKSVFVVLYCDREQPSEVIARRSHALEMTRNVLLHNSKVSCGAKTELVLIFRMHYLGYGR